MGSLNNSSVRNGKRVLRCQRFGQRPREQVPVFHARALRQLPAESLLEILVDIEVFAVLTLDARTGRQVTHEQGKTFLALAQGRLNVAAFGYVAHQGNDAVAAGDVAGDDLKRKRRAVAAPPRCVADMKAYLLQVPVYLMPLTRHTAVEIQQVGFLPDHFVLRVAEHGLDGPVAHRNRAVFPDHQKDIGTDTGNHPLELALTVERIQPPAIRQPQQQQQPEEEGVGDDIGQRYGRVLLEEALQRRKALDGQPVGGQRQNDPDRKPQVRGFTPISVAEHILQSVSCTCAPRPGTERHPRRPSHPRPHPGRNAHRCNELTLGKLQPYVNRG